MCPHRPTLLPPRYMARAAPSLAIEFRNLVNARFTPPNAFQPEADH